MNLVKRILNKTLNVIVTIYGLVLFCIAFGVWFIATKCGFKIHASSG